VREEPENEACSAVGGRANDLTGETEATQEGHLEGGENSKKKRSEGRHPLPRVSNGKEFVGISGGESKGKVFLIVTKVSKVNGRKNLGRTASWKRKSNAARVFSETGPQPLGEARESRVKGFALQRRESGGKQGKG